MDFRKKEPAPSSSNSRWGNLKGDDNTFQTVKRKSRYNKREEEAEKAREKREQLSGTMPLPGIDSDPIVEKKGKYLAPGKRSRDNKNSKSSGLTLSKNRDKKPLKPTAPDRNDESLFPTLDGSVNTTLENEETDKEVNKTTFADLVVSTDTPIKKEKVINNDIKPGWVKLSRGPNGRLIREYGPPVPKSQFWIDWERAELERKRQALIDTLERNREYVRWAYPYENWYDDESDYEDFEDAELYDEEWVSEDED